ncbi:MAG: threonylcarbamoyl-AMP synthase [Tannerella sp.]|jgi:L-threonylcarbamoyladenylate synthase|nr:threonylcarbamoyl-AMP synthase [Tannerella sp.]
MENEAKIFTDSLQRACDVLCSGGLILYPTDTIWGIGCDATDAVAVERIYALKRRIDRRSMLVLLDSPASLKTYVADVPAAAWDLLETAAKPLTIVYPLAQNVAPNLPDADGSLGIRITREHFSSWLCRMFGKPIVSTSANLSGRPAPASFHEITDEIRNGVDYVVRYRQDDITPVRPSSILKLEAGDLVRIIRE